MKWPETDGEQAQPREYLGCWRANCEDYVVVGLVVAAVGLYHIHAAGLADCIGPDEWSGSQKGVEKPMAYFLSILGRETQHGTNIFKGREGFTVMNNLNNGSKPRVKTIDGVNDQVFVTNNTTKVYKPIRHRPNFGAIFIDGHLANLDRPNLIIEIDCPSFFGSKDPHLDEIIKLTPFRVSRCGVGFNMGFETEAPKMNEGKRAPRVVKVVVVVCLPRPWMPNGDIGGGRVRLDVGSGEKRGGGRKIKEIFKERKTVIPY
ncbi:hypothetical protein Tco_0482448 [Tanacetum coccineum]